jgi:hypothetical protein
MRAYSNLLHMCRHDGIGIIEELGRGESLTECVYCILLAGWEFTISFPSGLPS